MTDKEIMYHRFQHDHLKKHTELLAEMLGMSRREYEAAVKRGMDEEARELRKEKDLSKEKGGYSNMQMKIKYEVEVDNMQEFVKAHSIVEELCHLYDGIDKEKYLTFGHAASYMLDIINGEQNDSKEV